MQTIIFALGLLAQDAAVQPVEAEEIELVKELAAVSEVALDMLSILPTDLESWQADGRELAMAQQYFAMVGREDLVERFVPGIYSPPVCPAVEGSDLNAMIETARNAQIVIINEAHNQPLHRFFVALMADILSEEFDVFAAETFNYLRLMEPRSAGALGYYDREPVFHRQIELVEAQGYRLVAYEIRAAQRDPDARTQAQRIAVREEAQANNLIAEVLADDPDARILVHVGYSHVLEVPIPAGEGEAPLEWFAYRLKQKTGIDPVTISQTHCSLGVDSDEADDAPATLTPGQVHLADPSGAVPAGALDFAIAHAPMTFRDGRPAWRFETTDRPIAVPETLRPTDSPVIIEVRAPEETLVDIPVDRLLLYPDDLHPLFIPAGDWVLTAWTGEDAYGEPVTLSVEAP